MGTDLDSLLADGEQALRRCRWDEAAAAFTAVLAEVEHASAVDGLGRARYWQQRYTEAFRLRERAYALHVGAGDHRGAALVAVRLAQWYALVHGNGAAMSGWIGHADRLLADDADCVEAGWLSLLRGCVCADPSERERRTGAASDIGRRLGDAALEYDARGYVGRSRIEQGDVSGGMALVDEAVAAVTGGLVTDPWAAGEIWCVLFGACELVADVGRAEQWLDAVDGYVRRTGELPIQAICRMHYGGALMAAGRFTDAERELRTALSIYDRTYVGTRREPLLRLCELLARAGRVEEAAVLVAGHEDVDAAARAWALVLAGSAQTAAARAVLERSLSARRDRVQDVSTLALAVTVALDDGDVAAADADVASLIALAGSARHPSIEATAMRCRALVAAARDEPTARGLLEQAVTALARAGLAHDAAVTRIALARLLAEEDRAVALLETRTARTRLRALGADRAADQAAALHRRIEEDVRRDEGATAGATDPDELLTSRQLEVLGLVAEGLSNTSIARRIVVSPRTVEHHVSNILRTLGVRSRTEAATMLVRSRMRRRP